MKSNSWNPQAKDGETNIVTLPAPAPATNDAALDNVRYRPALRSSPGPRLAPATVSRPVSPDAGPNARVQAVQDAVQETSQWVRPLQQEMGRVIVGQRHLIDRLLIALVTNGHVLLEGVPGLAKTLSLKTLAGGVSPWNHRYKEGPFTRTWHRNEKLLEESGHVTDLIAAEAVRWIESRGNAPFFLYVPFTAVHLPIKEPDEWLRRVPDSIKGDVPRHYAACVMHLDDAVGRIIFALEKKGRRDNTLLVFTSDNGGSTVENNDLKYPDDNCPNGKLTGNNKPWRGEKGSLYEGGTRVPTIVSWPGRAKPGKANSPVQITDWMPTLCTLAGYRPDRDLKWDGTNSAPLLTDHTDLPTRPLYAVAPGWRSRSLRLGDWKLIVHEEKNARKVELFDLAHDPAESKNQADQQPDKLKQLLTKLDEAAARDRDSVAKD